MKPTSFTVKTLLAALLFAGTAWAGCTGDRNGQPRQVVVQHSVQARECGSAVRADGLSQIGISPAWDGLETTLLPAGVFLYSSAEMRVENKASKGKPFSAIVVRESHRRESFQSQVVCVARPDSEAHAFDVSLHGLTKIKVDRRGRTEITVRQFQAYANPRGQGMIALNPRLRSQPMSTFPEFMASGASAKMYKLNERTYAMRIEREFAEGLRSELVITYDYIPR